MTKDDMRFEFLMSQIDGFCSIEKDRHDFAIEVATEEGRDEPTLEDEINGFRRLIDCVISKSRFSDSYLYDGDWSYPSA